MSLAGEHGDTRFQISEIGLIARLKSAVAFRSRRKRALLFLRELQPTNADRILDLGGGKGRHFAQHLGHLRNVWIADFNPNSLKYAEDHFGYKTILFDGTKSDGLPFEDRQFDVIFCSSVIEHVTGPKSEAVALFKKSGSAFRKAAFDYQKTFADEIRRSSVGYFVQTPYRYFPIEVHSWLPFLGFLPTHLQWAVLKITNRFWPRKDEHPDWSLLTETQMRQLFPDAKIHIERLWLFKKSIIAVRR